MGKLMTRSPTGLVSPGTRIVLRAKFTKGWTTVGLVKSNKHTAWVELTDGTIVKRRWRDLRM